jgi:16S rRNA (cytosine967-C5)-methyltransferase
MINARTLAFQILLHIDRDASHPDRLIRSTLSRHELLEERDRALLTELVYGVLRWRGRLDWHIDRLSRTNPSKISPAIRILLRLALYQVLMLDRIPDHAAVNEAVEIAKQSQPAYLVKFVNGVLREALRHRDDWSWPEPGAEPDKYVAVTTAHPEWFVRRLLQEYGLDETLDICAANNTIAPMTLRVNALRSAADEVLRWCAERGIEAEPSGFLDSAIRLSGLRRDLAGTSIYRDGLVQVQDEASQMVSMLVAPEPGDRVLDLCAGFGGKSTHLGILMGNQGEIVSVDHSAWKLEELRKNAQRQGVNVIEPRAADILEFSPGKEGAFDRVLLDAPCTGFGTLRRNPDIKWRRHVKDPRRFARIQMEMLDHAGLFVKQGGVLVYSTCTLFREENEVVAEHFTSTHPDWEIESAGDHLPDACRGMADGPYFHSWPHRHHVDGFFAARWKRRG